MPEEFFVNSQQLQNKIDQLLPSQGGAGANFDLSASTQIIPVIDLTESAEGSNVRADLQTSLSFNNCTEFAIQNTTATIISNTGYFRVFGNYNATGTADGNISLTDGVTEKRVHTGINGSNGMNQSFDFIVFLAAGDSLKGVTGAAAASYIGVTRQIADINGNIISPT